MQIGERSIGLVELVVVIGFIFHSHIQGASKCCWKGFLCSSGVICYSRPYNWLANALLGHAEAKTKATVQHLEIALEGCL